MELTILNKVVLTQFNSKKRKTLMLRNLESALLANKIIDASDDSIKHFRDSVAPDLLEIIQAYEDDVRLDGTSRMTDRIVKIRLQDELLATQRNHLKIYSSLCKNHK